MVKVPEATTGGRAMNQVLRMIIQQTCIRAGIRRRWQQIGAAAAMVVVVAGGTVDSVHALGGDVVSPYPVQDVRSGKQEAKSAAFDSAGNAFIVGYQNLSGGTD